MPSERQAGLEAGADDYLTKPFDKSDLFTALRDRGTLSGCEAE